MSLAALSVAALVLAVVVSCVSTLNVGVLAIALAWIVGVLVGGMPLATVIAGFPGSLFLTLVGVTLLFSLAHCNGTLDKLTHYAVRSCRGNRGVIPMMFFVLSAGLASIGPGNIATAALMAPMAMATAGRVGIPLFLMAIMVGNGANAGALSPIAPTGIIASGLMAKDGLTGYEGRTYIYSLLAHALVAFGGYFLFGGWKLFSSRGTVEPVVETTGENPLAANDSQFDVRHAVTLGVIALLLVGVIFFRIDVGMGAFAASVLLILFGFADDRQAIRQMPWGVLLMVTGVTVLIGVLDKAQGIGLIVAQIARLSTPTTVTGVVALLAGLVSVYASTSGVILPTFLPMVPDLAHQLVGSDPFAIASSINIGGHLVDVSPLSTIGALCIASAPITSDSRTLFNKLLAWGLSMSVVGALICYLFL